MITDRAAYTRGLEMLLKLQHTFHVKKRPPRSEVAALVQKIVKQSGMAGDNRERYFRLLCTSALVNREPLYSNWDRTKSKSKGVDHGETVSKRSGRDRRSLA